MKPTIPKGTRDFSSAEVARRNYIFDTIRSVFRLYGFAPIETPTMENLSTLMGKYGEEGDRLLFKILNSGDYGKDLTQSDLNNPSKICEKGLRYDLTVPFARYVVQHRAEITFPFKRYQIAPVWRADRPQKGRYREFVQCDVDVIGSRSLICEAELCAIVEEVFKRLNINVILKINNRKILAGIATFIGHGERLTDIAIAIDKLDKIGIDGVHKELLERGINASSIEKLQPILDLTGSNSEKLDKIEAIIGANDGVNEMRKIFAITAEMGLAVNIELDLSLARGLSYYTGAIFEVKSLDTQIGSISGGGRYDDLTGIFGLADTSGVGISFGAERIFDVMNELSLFPEDVEVSTKILFANFGAEDEIASIKAVQILRSKGVAAEIYPSADKLKKQFDYAEARRIPHLAFIGETERAENKITVKNLASGEQSNLSINELTELARG